MNCPFCNSTSLKVTNKRNSPEGIRRRRECLKCKKRFTTHERIAEPDIYVIKKNGSREKFDPLKLKKGIDKAFEKRPVPKEKQERMVFEIEEQIRKKGKNEIKSKIIGELMMTKIKKLDKVAYVRFASVYREFEDIKDFKEELRGL
ncbi:transcriptional regulator NrdR [Candidatus Pacearchaeota archaeon CG10_big_fil_rev_8_21_14_0_10_32_42]|nr:MAG: transcriptional regulator NrdR [Candidatus Pacearchaeota archaeon CG10_big_fil_rev_8_21_14_0_10_32_42]